MTLTLNPVSGSLLVGTRVTMAGKQYVITSTGPQRLDGNRKERRAKEAELRKAGAI